MDPVHILQTTLAGIIGGSHLNQSLPDVAHNNTMGTASSTPLATPLNLSTLISFLLSFSAMQDWLKLLVIGGVIETCRRTCLRMWFSFVESFWITACFDERDACYSKSTPMLSCSVRNLIIRSDWIMFWLSKHPKWGELNIGAMCVNVVDS